MLLHCSTKSAVRSNLAGMHVSSDHGTEHACIMLLNNDSKSAATDDVWGEISVLPRTAENQLN
jgi:hypothetical protein